VALRRQVVVQGYIVAFVAPASKLILEIAGGYHTEARRRRADSRRDRRLERAGFRVVRLTAALVLRE
jgi:very-short-patch-repair endonuclease